MVQSTVQCLSRGDTPTRAETFPGLHTPANYCSLINQHILISRTHMQAVRVFVCGYVPAVCLGAMVWICLGNRHTPLVENTHRHTRRPPLLGLHHVRGMFAERLLCADRTPRNRPVHTSRLTYIHTDSLLPSLNLWLHTTKLTLAKEERVCWVDTEPQVSHKQ